jgi:hypothetical protein
VAAKGGKVLDEAVLVGNDAGLGKAVHSFSDFLNEDTAIVDFVVELVVLQDAHMFIALHWSVKIEILDVHGHEFCIAGGEDAVQWTFDSCEINGGSGDFAGVLCAIAADSEADLAFLGFVWLQSGDCAKIGGFATFGHF